MPDRDDLLYLLIRGLRDKQSLTPSEWARIRSYEGALLRIATEPGPGYQKAMIAEEALKQ